MSRSGHGNSLEILGKVYHACQPVFSEGIHDAFLYGSYARGDYNEDSDVDILLTVDTAELGNYRWPIAEITSNLSLEYDKTISVTVKPLWQFQKYADVLPYYKNIIREGIRYNGQ